MPKRVNIFYSKYDYEPETIAYMTFIGVPDDSTVYFASTAYEITGRGAWRAYDRFYKAAKTVLGLTHGINNISSKIDAMYGAFGTASAQQKANMSNPLDTDAAFRLSFSGGWTFSGAGMQPNGTNGYANTHWDSTNQATSTRIAYGGYWTVADTAGIHGTWDLNNSTRNYDQSTPAKVYTIGNTSGMTSAAPYTRFHMVKVTAASTKVISNGAVQYNAGAISYTTINKPFYIGARNNNSASVNQYTNGTLGFYFITGKHEFTDTEAFDFELAVKQLMSDLNRAV